MFKSYMPQATKRSRLPVNQISKPNLTYHEYLCAYSFFHHSNCEKNAPTQGCSWAADILTTVPADLRNDQAVLRCGERLGTPRSELYLPKLGCAISTSFSAYETMLYLQLQRTFKGSPCPTFFYVVFHHNLLKLLQSPGKESNSSWPLHLSWIPTYLVCSLRASVVSSICIKARSHSWWVDVGWILLSSTKHPSSYGTPRFPLHCLPCDSPIKTRGQVVWSACLKWHILGC